MNLTILKQLAVESCDPDEIVDLLELDAEEILNRFMDKFIEKEESFKFLYLEDDENEEVL
jgi:hypothetical protein